MKTYLQQVLIIAFNVSMEQFLRFIKDTLLPINHHCKFFFFFFNVLNPQVNISLPCNQDFPDRFSNENGGYAPVRTRQHQAGCEGMGRICTFNRPLHVDLCLELILFSLCLNNLWRCRLWSMTSTQSWWKMPAWACVLRSIVLWSKAISSWMKRTRRAWRSSVGAATSTSFCCGLLVCSLLAFTVLFFSEIVDQPGVDIFGQVYNQWKNKECECPNCKRLIAASRFAPHLEKCLGMGRNSSRIANRRSVSQSVKAIG